jgi:Methyltransferase domain
MVGLKAHYSARDIEARILAAIRAVGLNPGYACRRKRWGRLHCIKLSPEFCAGAELLNRLTGLDDLIAVHRGSALDLPFPDDSFDAVWMQSVGMNIADKQGGYAEISPRCSSRAAGS